MMDFDQLFYDFASLHKRLGQDLEKYVKRESFEHSLEFIEWYKKRMEDELSRDYLPGFRFEDVKHAAWHFRIRDYPPYWIFNLPIPPERFMHDWVRALLVPNRYHYLAEVAHALKQADLNTAAWIRELNHLRNEGDPHQLRRAVNAATLLRRLRALPPGPVEGPRKLMGTMSWPKRMEVISPTGSAHRWARRVRKDRQQRRAASPPSGWIISSISFHGRLNEKKSVRGLDKRVRPGYFEVWRWEPLDGRPSPKCTELPFRSPASDDLWQHLWKRKKYRLD
ncbi:MAG: hypothetical protein R6X16_12170 [Anaerolineae bacterium]